MNGNIKTETKRVGSRYTLAALGAILLGVVLSLIRGLIIFGEYDNGIALYPNGALKTSLILCYIGFSLLLVGLGIFVCGDKKSYRQDYKSTPMIFADSLLAFSFAALAISVFLNSSISGIPLTAFDSVLMVLSLVAAVAFISEAFSKEETLGADASVILKLFGPICCLFITFYFYFDGTTPIHNSNKKVAALAFVFALLSILYATKTFVGKANKAVYVCSLLFSVSYSIAYFAPNLVWYFRFGRPILLNVFFDFLALALGVYSAVSLLSFISCEREGEGSAEDIVGASDTEKLEAAPESESLCETSAEEASADVSAEADSEEK